jgi:hypothetical protein
MTLSASNQPQHPTLYLNDFSLLRRQRQIDLTLPCQPNPGNKTRAYLLSGAELLGTTCHSRSQSKDRFAAPDALKFNQLLDKQNGHPEDSFLDGISN